MHFIRKSICLNGLEVLLILLLTYSTSVSSAGLTQEEIAEAVRDVPKTYCGRRLTAAMKEYCAPPMRAYISGSGLSKKSMDSNSEFEFDPFDLDRIAAESYDDDLLRSRYKIDDTYFSNDIPFMFSSQGNRRRRRGIIDECCKRACYKTELVKYCPVKAG